LRGVERKQGSRFVSTAICHSLMQATGMIDDHLVTGFRHWARH